MIIYKITNLINNKIYVGQDKNNNSFYLGSGTAIKNAIKKYGKENFKKDILETCSDCNELNEKEIYWIDKLNSRDKEIGYNISKGGDEGNRSQHGSFYQCWVEKYGKDEADIKLSEMKEKISKSIKEIGIFSNYGKNGVYKYWVEKYGKDEADIKLENKKNKLRDIEKQKKLDNWHHSEETKKKISDSSKNRILSDETKKKISESRKGMIFSDEARENMSLAQKGRISSNKGKKLSNETKDKIRKKLKGKYYGNKNNPFEINNVKYNTLKEASESLNINSSTISYRLKSNSIKYTNYIFLKKND